MQKSCEMVARPVAEAVAAVAEVEVVAVVEVEAKMRAPLVVVVVDSAALAAQVQEPTDPTARGLVGALFSMNHRRSARRAVTYELRVRSNRSIGMKCSWEKILSAAESFLRTMTS